MRSSRRPFRGGSAFPGLGPLSSFLERIPSLKLSFEPTARFVTSLTLRRKKSVDVSHNTWRIRQPIGYIYADGENMLAERLKLVRQARGWSLDELSQAMDRLVSKQAISKYENGEDTPSPRVLVALANALGVRADRLLDDDGVEVETLFYRRKSKLGAKEQARLTALLSTHLLDAVRLRRLVSPGECFELPIRSLPVKTFEDPETHAEELRRQWNLGEEPLSTVTDVLEEHGVSVCMSPADGDFDGLSAVARNLEGEACGAAVMCRDGLTRERQRLNLAHELGHVLLDPSDEGFEESAAWRFAGAFLAPKDRLLEDVGHRRRSISFDELLLLKRRYGMSIQALLMRLKDLHVLSEEATKQAFVQMSRLKMRVNEPGDTLHLESPQWFRRTVLRAVSEGLLDSLEATELLGEEVRPSEPKRNQFVHLLASMSPEEREPYLDSIGPDDSLDEDWLEADLGDTSAGEVSG